jgi:uncharacterized phage protein gp47/JayE
MGYTKPTLQELIDSIKADLFSRFPTLDVALANSFAASLAEVLAGGVNGLYGYLDWIADQPFPDTASDENLERLANIFGLSRLAATQATGTVTFTGSIGSAVLTGAELVSSSGAIYSVDTGFILASGSEDHTVTAVLAGLDANLAAAGSLSFVSTPAGMDGTATVDSGGLTGGTDRETDAELRTRVLQKLASPPKGGKAEDYEAWAIEATDVTRSWVRNISSADDSAIDEFAIPAGDVWQYFVMDETYTTPATIGIPAAGDVTDVQDYIDALRPVTAIYTSKAPTAQTIAFNISIIPFTPANQEAVDSELLSTILNERVVGGIIAVSSFYEAMSRVPNLTNWVINSIDGIAPADVDVAAGVISTKGTATIISI